MCTEFIIEFGTNRCKIAISVIRESRVTKHICIYVLLHNEVINLTRLLTQQFTFNVRCDNWSRTLRVCVCGIKCKICILYLYFFLCCREITILFRASLLHVGRASSYDENHRARVCQYRRHTIYQVTYPLRHVNWYLYMLEHRSGIYLSHKLS